MQGLDLLRYHLFVEGDTRGGTAEKGQSCRDDVGPKMNEKVSCPILIISRLGNQRFTKGNPQYMCGNRRWKLIDSLNKTTCSRIGTIEV